MHLGVTVRAIAHEDTHLLRQAVLRPHQRADELHFHGDDHPQAGHYGAFDADTLVGIASICPEGRDGAAGAGSAWRVRGMAVTPAWRDRGVGALLLHACLDHARERGGRAAWCNARIGARRFYEAHGFAVDGEPFELPDIGVHYVMERPL